MTEDAQRALAAEFRDLHDGPEILKLPCAWDAASARLFEEVGFPAIGTSSAAIAHSLGHADGQHVPIREMVGAIERIARAVSVPVSADLEAGYGTTVDAVTRNVRDVIEAGAVGVNLEDGTGADADPLIDIDEQVAVIESVRSLADSLDLPLVINARTDVYLRGEGSPADRFREAIERANAYSRAGADCLFVIGVADPSVIADLVAELDGPLNVLAFGPDGPSPSRLEDLGVARVSTGAGAKEMSLAVLGQFGEHVLETGEYPEITGNRVPRWDLQEWFAPQAE